MVSGAASAGLDLRSWGGGIVSIQIYIFFSKYRIWQVSTVIYDESTGQDWD